jgi:hypothetical protein
MPTVLSLGQPATTFQFAYMLYLYGLPFLLWAVYAYCVLEDEADGLRAGLAARPLRTLVALLLPLAGAAVVLLSEPRTRHRYGLIVILGLVAFALPLAAGLWLAGGPLGPKALG